MNCDDVRAAYLAGDGGRGSEGHLAGCASCRALVPEMDRLRRHLDDPAQWEVPNPEMEGRVVQAVVAEVAALHPRTQGSSLARRWRSAAAAAAVAVVLLGALVTFLRPDEPDWELALAPTTSAPGASAVVRGWNEETGTRMTFDITGLEPVANAYYAIWLTAPDGRHVPAGTFRSSGKVTSWAAVRRRDFPRIWITLETDDGDESLNGRTVLDLPT